MNPDGLLEGVTVAVAGAGPAAWGVADVGTLARDACARLLAQLGANVQRPVGEDDSRGAIRIAELVLVTDPRIARSGAIQHDTRPDAAVVSISPYGLAGPAFERPDTSLSRHYGLATAPVIALGAAHATIAALALLYQARRSGRGGQAEVALLDVLAASLGSLLTAVRCPAPQPLAGRALLFRCADGYVQVPRPTDEEREDWAALTGLVALAEPAAEVAPLLGPWLATQRRLDIVDEAQAWRLAVTPVLAPLEYTAAVAGLGATDGASTCPEDRVTWLRVHRVATTESQPVRPIPRPHAQMAPADRPLAGLRVLDLGMVWAGPYAGLILADLGADVVKIEGPRRPDGTRQPPHPGCSGQFADFNAGKSSLVLHLGHGDGRRAFLALAGQADVVVESFSPRVMPSFGLDPSVLLAVNPGLVGISLPAFAPDGPWSQYVAYGAGLEAVTGLAWRDGDAPRLEPVPFTDLLVGCYGAIASLAGLIHRDGHGSGDWLTVPQAEVAREVVALRARLAVMRDSDADASPAHVARTSPRWDAAGLLADRYLAARGLFPATECAGCPGRHLRRLPYLLHGRPSPAARGAPAFGEHTVDLLRGGAGLTPAEVTDLLRRGIAVQHAPAALPTMNASSDLVIA